MKMPTICWPFDRLVAIATTIDGTAGRLMSTVSAAMAVRKPSVITKLGPYVGLDDFTIRPDWQSGR